jgi:hypothetical protein
VQELTFEEEENYDLKAQCGNMVVLHVMVFDPTVEVTAYARDGTTALGDKVTVGAHVRLNEDDDDADGGGTVQDKDDNDVRLPDGTPTEDDLIKVRFTFDPGFEHLQIGKVALKRENSKIRLWKKHYKGGSGNEFVFNQAGNTEKVYNLSNASPRSAFLSDVRDTSAWVEGSVASGGLKDAGLLLIYRDQDDEEVDSDLVKFTVIRSNLVPYTADGATPIFLDKRDTPGVYIRYNRDDDDRNDTEDRDDVLTTVTGEDDLLKVQCLFNEFFATLQNGRVVLERVNPKLRLWRSSTKGDGQEIGFTNNRKVYDLSGQDRQDFLDQVHGKNLWLEGYEYSANLRDTGLSLIYEDPNGKEVCRNSVVYTVLKLDVTHMAFNVDRTEVFSDGLNIRRSGAAGTEIRAPEWWEDGGDQGTESDTNDAVCYQTETAVNIRVRLTVTPNLNSVEIVALGTKSGGGAPILGDLGAQRGVGHSWKSVTFENGVSTGDTVEGIGGFVVFLPQNSTAACIDRDEVKWQFRIRSVNGDYVFPPLNLTAPGQRSWLRIYTVCGLPEDPWDTTDTTNDDLYQPWVNALEFVTQTAGVKGMADFPAAVQLTTFLFSAHGLVYDSAGWGAAHYTSSPLGGTFDLTGYVAKTSGFVNCFDQAAALCAFAGVVGIAACYKYLNPFGFIPTCNLVGCGSTNNPFWLSTTPPKAKIAGADDVQTLRDPFSCHAFIECYATHGGARWRIYDACVGPWLGTDEFVDYYETAHDASSGAEENWDDDPPYLGLTDGGVSVLR